MTAPIKLDVLRAAVGTENVFSIDHESARSYRDRLQSWLGSAMMPQAVVKPANEQDIATVLTTAASADFGVAVCPNHSGNGMRLPHGGKPTVLLDLSRMQRIIEFDTESACALLEPGVSFDQLQAYVDEYALPFWIDADENGAHSVAGSICSRSVGASPYGDHLLMQCGMEVVLANGDIVRTGMGALPGNDTWQLFKYNFGPYLDGLFSQSNLAVVSKIGLWLMPAPPDYRPFMLELPDTQTLGVVMDRIRPLRISMVLPNTIVAAHVDADTALARRAGITMPEESENYPWRVYGALYGISDNVDLTWQAVAAQFTDLDNIRLTVGDERTDDALWQLRRNMMRGRAAFSAAAGAETTLSFTVGAPIESEAVAAIESVLAQDTGDGCNHSYAATWRTMQATVEMDYSAETLSAVTTRALQLIDKLGSAGFGITHESVELKHLLETRGSDQGLAALHTKLSAQLDPAGVLRGAT